jgi:hypothetical protein
MAEVRMLAQSVGVANGRSVVKLVSVEDPNDDNEATGQATITVNDPDDLDAFEQGQVYWVSFEKAGAEDAGPHAAALATVREAALIPNSTNTPNYKTPPELKIPPPPVPDGVVTEPRPSVVMAPISDAPATAGVASGPALNVGQTPETPPTPAPSQPASPTKASDKK